jgi:acetyl esterase
VTAHHDIPPAILDGAPVTIEDIPLAVVDLPALRQRCVDLAPTDSGTGPAVHRVDDVRADGVACRLYRPQTTQTKGAVVYAHGGGWVMGSLDTDDALCRELAVRSGLPVLAVDYRLAPEHPYPAALHDLETAGAWLRGAGARRYGVVAERLVLVGESAGAHLAAVVARRARDGGTPYHGQVLVNPVIDPQRKYPDNDTYRRNAECMRFYWDAYAPRGVDRAELDLNPLAADLAGLPPALVITADYDVLRDEGEKYATALAESGVPTTAVRYLGVHHGFVNFFVTVYAATSAARLIASTAIDMVS